MPAAFQSCHNIIVLYVLDLRFRVVARVVSEYNSLHQVFRLAQPSLFLIFQNHFQSRFRTCHETRICDCNAKAAFQQTA